MCVLTQGPRLNFCCHSTIFHLQTLEKKKFGIWKLCSWYAGGMELNWLQSSCSFVICPVKALKQAATEALRLDFIK